MSKSPPLVGDDRETAQNHQSLGKSLLENPRRAAHVFSPKREKRERESARKICCVSLLQQTSHKIFCARSLSLFSHFGLKTRARLGFSKRDYLSFDGFGQFALSSPTNGGLLDRGTIVKVTH